MAKILSARSEPELVLFLDVNTGIITSEGIVFGNQPTTPTLDQMRQFRTGIAFDPEVVKTIGIKGIDINQDWIGQILGILYPALTDLGCDRYQHLLHRAFLWRVEADMDVEELAA